MKYLAKCSLAFQNIEHNLGSEHQIAYDTLINTYWG